MLVKEVLLNPQIIFCNKIGIIITVLLKFNKTIALIIKIMIVITITLIIITITLIVIIFLPKYKIKITTLIKKVIKFLITN